MAALLIAEDDKKTSEAICEYLLSAGHRPINKKKGRREKARRPSLCKAISR